MIVVFEHKIHWQTAVTAQKRRICEMFSLLFSALLSLQEEGLLRSDKTLPLGYIEPKVDNMRMIQKSLSQTPRRMLSGSVLYLKQIHNHSSNEMGTML